MKGVELARQRVTVTRSIIQGWLRGSLVGRHHKRMVASFAKRHEYFEKRVAVRVFMANRQLGIVLSARMRAMIAARPSQCLWIVSALRDDDTGRIVNAAFGGWLRFVHRRRLFGSLVKKGQEARILSPAAHALGALRKEPFDIDHYREVSLALLADAAEHPVRFGGEKGGKEILRKWK
jgi:hypothetical protein